ncbi:MAG: hypothetical protein MJ246_05700 [Clostridia bacterium]|nr:hypothetical protein [Clostridia bacterium]
MFTKIIFGFAVALVAAIIGVVVVLGAAIIAVALGFGTNALLGKRR